MVLPLTFLSDYRWRPWKWVDHRMEEQSGSGDGRYWVAELAPPLWSAELVSEPVPNTVAERIAAAVRHTLQTREPFLLTSPIFCKPHADLSGSNIAAASPILNSIRTERRFVNITGLPANYVLTAGDKFSIAYGSGKRYFGEVSVTTQASPGGSAANVPVFPPLPLSLGTGGALVFVRPACPVVVRPGSYNPGDVRGGRTTGISISVIQKK